jgi:hypothetical protein
MSARRTERLLNLVIALLATRRWLTKEQIRAAVPQYADGESAEAFDRMFERDKEDLRELGVPIVTGTDSAWFDDEIGYRIDRDAYALPPVQIDAERAGDGPGEADETTVEWGLFSWQFIRRRLDALSEELERLDRDPDVFAKAFHTMVARSAYEALLADASRLADQPRRYAGQTLDVEFVGPSTGMREVLEL